MAERAAVFLSKSPENRSYNGHKFLPNEYNCLEILISRCPNAYHKRVTAFCTNFRTASGDLQRFRLECSALRPWMWDKMPSCPTASLHTHAENAVVSTSRQVRPSCPGHDRECFRHSVLRKLYTMLRMCIHSDNLRLLGWRPAGFFDDDFESAKT